MVESGFFFPFTPRLIIRVLGGVADRTTQTADCRQKLVKVFLWSLAALLFATALIYFLSGTTAPLGRMTLTKEALVEAPDRSDGSRILFQAAKDPSGSRIVGPDRSANAFRSVSTEVLRELTRINSWVRQTIRPAQDKLTAQARRDPNVITITHDVSIHIKHGIVGLPAGKKLALVARRGETVQVRDINGANYDIPISATDLQ